MTRWEHKCSLDWLMARQNYLTATDVKDLLPVTATGRKRTITDETYLKVLARKHVALGPDDCISTGAAARGHILEPYAIAKFNKEFGANMFHWDDAIVTSKGSSAYDLVFSPDAMSIPQLTDTPVTDDIGDADVKIAEVKCYYPEKHFICGNSKKESLEERWQIAAAMAVRPEISKAYLIFYNPSMNFQMYVFEYDRADLADEIKIVQEVEALWHQWIDNFTWATESSLVMGDKEDEGRIVDAIIESEKLNPTGCRTVER